MRDILRSGVILWIIFSLGVSQTLSQPLLQAQTVPQVSPAQRAQLMTIEDGLLYIAQQIDQTVYEPAALAARLATSGSNSPASGLTAARRSEGIAEAVASFIASSIALRPYWGSLRGPRGVLADRTGNSLDRVLLAEVLLNANGLKTRIGQTSLAADSVALLRAQTTVPVPPVAPSYELTPELIALTTRDFGIDAGSLQAEVQQAITSATNEALAQHAALAEFEAHVSPLISPLVAPLVKGDTEQTGRPALLTAPVDETDAQLAEFFWIETLTASGQWRPIDLLPIPMADLAISPPAIQYVATSNDLPAHLVHRLTLEIVIGVDGPDGPATKVLSSLALTVPEAAFSSVSIIYRPDAAQAGDQATTGPDAPQVPMLAGREMPDKMAVTISVDDAAQTVRFDDTGKILGENAVSEATDKGFGGAANVLGNLFAAPEDPPQSAPQVTHLDLRLVMSSSRGLKGPARLEPHTRRIATAGEGPGMGFGDMWLGQVVTLPFAVTEPYAAQKSIERMVWSARALTSILRSGQPVGFLQTPWSAFAHTGAAALTSAIVFGAAPTTWSNGTTLAIEDARLTADPDGLQGAAEGGVAGAGFATRAGLDLVRIAQAGDPASTSAPNGLIWTRAEALALDIPGVAVAPKSAAQSLLALQDLSPEGLVILPAGSPLPPNLTLGAAGLTPRVVGAALAAGLDVALLPDAEVWLTRDPSTGLWIGRDAEGRGNAEYVIENAEAIDAGRILLELALCVSTAMTHEDDGRRYFDTTVCILNLGGSVSGFFVWGLALLWTLPAFALCGVVAKTAGDFTRCAIGASFFAASGVVGGKGLSGTMSKTGVGKATLGIVAARLFFAVFQFFEAGIK